jgi:hypothetical protein
LREQRELWTIGTRERAERLAYCTAFLAQRSATVNHSAKSLQILLYLASNPNHLHCYISVHAVESLVLSDFHPSGVDPLCINERLPKVLMMLHCNSSG